LVNSVTVYQQVFKTCYGPALFTKTSTGPHSASTRSAAAATSPCTLTSTASTRTSGTTVVPSILRPAATARISAATSCATHAEHRQQIKRQAEPADTRRVAVGRLPQGEYVCEMGGGCSCLQWLQASSPEHEGGAALSREQESQLTPKPRAGSSHQSALACEAGLAGTLPHLAHRRQRAHRHCSPQHGLRPTARAPSTADTGAVIAVGG
jgi:hypothetical protein